MNAATNAAKLREIADEISVRYHSPLGQELPQLRFMAQKVAQVHGTSHPPAVELGTAVREVIDSAEDWLALETREVLPLLASAKPITITRTQMMAGHEKRKEVMARIRSLTDSYLPWVGACGTVARLYLGLSRLEGVLAEYAKVEETTLGAQLAE